MPSAVDAELFDDPVLLHFVGKLSWCDAQASGGPRLDTAVFLQRPHDQLPFKLTKYLREVDLVAQNVSRFVESTEPDSPRVVAFFFFLCGHAYRNIQNRCQRRRWLS